MKIKSTPLIFIVEDNHIYRNLVVSYLKTHKLSNVEVYSTGEEVLENLKKNPEIIVSDYILGGKNGLELLQQTKEILPMCEVIFLSGQNSIDVAVAAMKHGVYDYVVKDKEALGKLVNKIHNIITHKAAVESKKIHKVGVKSLVLGLLFFILGVAAFRYFFPYRF